ncbi:MAG: hypothetical protein SFY81_14520 [Verrucomicrobiota bacterium]|nr:hypothetical protein [Verrucomicrobiota bacterium]
MKAAEFLAIAERLMSQPAVAYHETGVRDTVLAICSEHHLPIQEDRYGNLLVTYQKGTRRRPLVLGAHMDHPGFELGKILRKNRFQGRFLGGVPRQFFKPGIPLLLFPGAIKGKLVQAGKKESIFEIQAEQPCTAKFAVWALKEFDTNGETIFGRACDDLIGVAAILATLITLKRERRSAHLIGAITRAEEIGFHGALALAKSAVLPKDCLIISLETSREMPPVRTGEGVIIRVGDRSSIFSSSGTRFIQEVASELQARDKQFKYQAALMRGGTCEATAYQEYGFETAALCVALTNYHNCGPNEQILEESVSLGDSLSMVQLLCEISQSMPRSVKLSKKLNRRLEVLAKTALKQLRLKSLPALS